MTQLRKCYRYYVTLFSPGASFVARTLKLCKRPYLEATLRSFSWRRLRELECLSFFGFRARFAPVLHSLADEEDVHEVVARRDGNLSTRNCRN